MLYYVTGYLVCNKKSTFLFFPATHQNLTPKAMGETHQYINSNKSHSFQKLIFASQDEVFLRYARVTIFLMK